MAVSSPVEPTTPASASAPRIPRHHRLILVRHALSHVEPARPPVEWDLSPEGEKGAVRLAALGLFDRAHAFYCGPEPKMVSTLAPAAAERGQTVNQEEAFGETHSEGFFHDASEFRATVRRLFEHPVSTPAPGWESASDAVNRFKEGVERLRTQFEPEQNRDRVLPATLVISSGGRMLISYLAAVLDWSLEEAFTRWEALRMPDIAVLELDEAAQGTLVFPFGTLTP